VTVLGGGNGASSVLRGLVSRKNRGVAMDIRTIVATADDGGSSGRLRRQRGGLPPGDLRNCLLALAADPDRPDVKLFAHRFCGTGELGGHAMGNLVLAALAEQEGCYLRAIERAGEMLSVDGQVIPVSLESVALQARTSGGEHLAGESVIGDAAQPPERVWLVPADVHPAPGVIDAIVDADLIVIGPGSLFTSLLAVLMVPGVADAVRGSRAVRVIVANLMTQPGETLGMDLTSHLEAIDRHVGPGLADHVIYHCERLAGERLGPYLAVHAQPLRPPESWTRTEVPIARDLATLGGKVRHDPGRLADALLGLWKRQALQATPRNDNVALFDAERGARREGGRRSE
jgi:uncharacterized cofD-like protein